MTQQLRIDLPSAARIDAMPRALMGPLERSPRFDARQMTGNGTTAEIVLDDKIYTLRITRAGKLILTK